MKLRPFELGLVIVFIGLAFLSLVLLSTYSSKSKGADTFSVGSVSIWGTLEPTSIGEILRELSTTNDAYKGVTYRYIAPEALDNTLVNALADGEGPDLLLVSHERLVELRKRITPVAYESFPLTDIRNSYVDGAQIFALSEGLYAYPIAVDPIVMYSNRDLLTTAGFLTPPITWEELVNTQFPNLIQRNFDRTITRNVVAMGEYGNVRNSFGIISTLLLQAGSKGVLDEGAGRYEIQLNESINGNSRPLNSVLDFYTRFSRPSNSLYSWNRSFSEDRSRFTSEDLVFYFGYGSEGVEIERLNPNLNFGIAEVPQGATATVRRTYGKFYGLSLMSASNNKAGAASMMGVLGSQLYAARIAEANNMAPAHRSAVAAGSNGIYGRIIYRSAGVAMGWLSPGRDGVDAVFTTMTRDVNENRYDEAQAAEDAIGRLQLEYN